MHADIKSYNEKQESGDKEICNLLALIIDKELKEAKAKSGTLTLYGLLMETQL